MSKLEVTPAAPFSEYNKLNFEGLYLYHTYDGPKANQVEIVNNKAPTGFGATVVNNWEVYDGPGPDAKLVAHAQGLHTHAGNWVWVNYFSLVFVNEKFSGSTLEVMGKAVESGEWAVVGGTGQFAMANGVISKKVHSSNDSGNVIELSIRAFYPKLNETSTQYQITKIGPCGGLGGFPRDITEASKRLESITIGIGSVVNTIAFSYINTAGEKRSAGPWGGNNIPAGQPHTIQLAESEFVTEVSGTVGDFGGSIVITSIKFVTNLNNTYGPWGNGKGNPFTITVPPGNGIVGFFSRTGAHLDAIGVYVRPL